MNLIRKAFTTLGGIFLAALLISALAPKAARGVAAALVQVSNTTANPVPTVSADANFPFEADMCTTACSSLPNYFAMPTTTTTGVPVKRWVIEDLNATCQDSTPGVVQVFVNSSADTDPPGSNSLIYPFLVNGVGPGGTYGHAIVRMYADPSTYVEVSGDSRCYVVLTGHLETK